MAREKQPPSDYDAELRARLIQLAEDHPQSDIARKTNTPQSSVSRYLKERKVPAEFCAALIRNLGVNPAWLLAGEGTRYTADVTADAGDTASQLVELVGAMNTVARLKLGALVGKDHQKTLRHLNDQIESYEKLREKVDAATRPMFVKLNSDLAKAIKQGNFESAERIIRAAEQVSRLCNDEALRMSLDSGIALVEHERGNIDRAIELRKRLWRHQLGTASASDARALYHGANLVVAMRSAHRLEEARRYTRACLELMKPFEHVHAYKVLLFSEGVLEVDLGMIASGLPKMLNASEQLTAAYRARNKPVICQALLLRGTLSLEQILLDANQAPAEAAEKPSMAGLLAFACWEEKAAALDHVWQRFGRSPDGIASREQRLLIHHNVALREALSGRKKAIGDFCNLDDINELKRPGVSVAAIHTRVAECQIARLCGRRAEALKAFDGAAKLFGELPAEYTAPILVRAIHARNALELFPASARSQTERRSREQAQAFFDDYYARGYTCFRPMVNVVEAPDILDVKDVKTPL
ncbi:MAG: helix-turn-helix transcriptional regulator [Planctomycetaceae bacterium]|nr:helix-turn-helix transcriptional regulator [Planctomycetaceae bacterium]